MRACHKCVQHAVVGRNPKGEIDMALGINETLTEAGSGLGSFLTSIQAPVVNIVLALGIIGGILSIFYGVASVIRRAVGGATTQIGR
jgi:hypothetical protein